MQNIIISRFGRPNHNKREWKKILLYIILFALLCVAIAGLILGVESWIRNNIVSLSVDNDANAAWVGSLASYWGGILGGIISGTLAMIGVFFTIRYYKESDRKKERAAVQPFLNTEIIPAADSPDIKEFEIVGRNKSSTKQNQREFREMWVRITNIGVGFADTLTIGTGKNLMGEAYTEVITVGDSRIIKLKVDANLFSEGHSAEFFFVYIDAMTNEYYQSYSIEMSEDGRYKIVAGYPNLI